VVQDAHDRGLVHRDLKPSNVMVLESEGRLIPKLLDLGIAVVLHNVAPPLPWISPEALAAGIATAQMRAGDTKFPEDRHGSVQELASDSERRAAGEPARADPLRDAAVGRPGSGS